jgi:hypothetical protein
MWEARTYINPFDGDPEPEVSPRKCSARLANGSPGEPMTLPARGGSGSDGFAGIPRARIRWDSPGKERDTAEELPWDSATRLWVDAAGYTWLSRDDRQTRDVGTDFPHAKTPCHALCSPANPTTKPANRARGQDKECAI